VSAGTLSRNLSRVAAIVAIAMAAFAVVIVTLGSDGPRLRYILIAMLVSGVLCAAFSLISQAAQPADNKRSPFRIVFAACLVALAAIVTLDFVTGSRWLPMQQSQLAWAIVNVIISGVVALRIGRRMTRDRNAPQITGQMSLAMQVFGVVILWLAWFLLAS